MEKDMDQIRCELAAPFCSADVEWRVSSMNKEKNRGLAVPYLQSRAIQSRLDTVVGPYHWKSEYKPWHSVSRENTTTASQLCGIAVYCEERKEWIQKWDGAENTDIEPVKGGISDSFKRAAVLWGIGRYLYSLDGVWVNLDNKRITAAELQRLNTHYENSLGLTAGNISPFPGSQLRQPAAPQPFDYAVRLVEPRQFASGNGLALQLQSYDGKSVEAFLQSTDQNLIEGACLRHVKLTAHENNGYRYHTMDAYEVA